MGIVNCAVVIDKEKLRKAIEKSGKDTKSMSLEMGYDRLAIVRTFASGSISKPMMLLMEKMYGISYEMIKPDEQKVNQGPEKKEAPAAAPAQQAQVDLSRMEDMLLEAVKTLKKNEEFLDTIKMGFRVQTKPSIISQDISLGVREGMQSWWQQNKQTIISQFRGAMFAAMWDAMHKEQGDKK